MSEVQPGDIPGSWFTWPSQDFAGIAADVAADVALLLSDEPQWVHRRVETVTYRDETSLRRHTSVDFTIPDWVDSYPTGNGSDRVYLPITLLDKRVLEDFDLRDEAGGAISLLPRAENSKVATEVLIQAAEGALRAAAEAGNDVKTELHAANRVALAALAGDASAPTADDDSPEAAGQAQWVIQDEIALAAIRELSQSFILLVALNASPGDRRIIKFAYNGEYVAYPHLRAGDGWSLTRRTYEWMRAKGRNLLEVLGVFSFTTGFAVPALADAESYHVELSVPDEVLAEAALTGLDEDGTTTLLDRGRGTGRLHLYGGAESPVSGRLGWVEVDFSLRPTVVWPVTLLSCVTTTTLVVGLLAHYWWKLPTRSDVTGPLIVALPTLFAPVAAPGSHGLVRRMFKGLRGLVFLSALVSFAAAATLALGLRPSALVHTGTVWICLAGVSITLSSVSFFALVRSLVRTRSMRLDS